MASVWEVVVEDRLGRFWSGVGDAVRTDVDPSVGVGGEDVDRRASKGSTTAEV